MQQIQIPYKNSPDFINKLLQLRNYFEDNDLKQALFYVNWVGEVKNKLFTVCDKIEEIFPESIYYGNETSGNIASGELGFGINITVYLFESDKTKLDLVWVEKGSKVPTLQALWNVCKNKKNLKGVELLPTLSYAEYLKIDKCEPDLDDSVVIFGGTAAQYNLPFPSSEVIAKNHDRSSDAMVVLLYSGEDLHFEADHVLGWQGLGKLFTVTKAKGNIIEELDGITPYKVYQEYLGADVTDKEAIVFPLIVYEDGHEFIRNAKDYISGGTMEMFVDIPEGTKVRLSYGDKNTVLSDIHETVMKIAKTRAEGIRTYSCAARRLFWGDDEVSRETTSLNKVAPVCGFYSSGEIIRFGKKLRICNETLSIISLWEFEGRDNNEDEFSAVESDKSMTSRLAYFTRKVTQELEENITDAEAANRAKSTFLFNMSHDIRTPLNAIIGFTNIAERDIKNTKKAFDAIQKVHNSTEILLSIINDVLDMSRIESGKATLKVEDLEIGDIYKRTNLVLKTLASSKNVNLSYKEENVKTRYVKVDENLLQRVLMNIISNAIKYTNEGGHVEVTIREIDSSSPNKAHFTISVKDDGIGMSEEFQQHMFEEFAREKTSTVSGIQGTGLGLPLANRLTKLMGGSIYVESKQGVGSTFTVDIEVEKANDGESTIGKTEAETTFDFTGKRALIVEDNELNREIGLDIMTESGIVADGARNGLEAVNILKEKGPDYYDFILMDIQMPVMNGYDATKTIRSMYPNDKIIIIAVSANAFNEDKIASTNAGMNDHVAKPIDIATLKKTMAKYL